MKIPLDNIPPWPELDTPVYFTQAELTELIDILEGVLLTHDVVSSSTIGLLDKVKNRLP